LLGLGDEYMFLVYTVFTRVFRYTELQPPPLLFTITWLSACRNDLWCSATVSGAVSATLLHTWDGGRISDMRCLIPDTSYEDLT
jgi:hypothetical protein